MMQKTATLNLRVDPDVKHSAELVLSQLGLSMSTAIDIFLRQVSLTGSIPFKVGLPGAPQSLDAERMTDVQLRDAIARGLQEAKDGNAMEAAAVFSSLREEFEIA